MGVSLLVCSKDKTLDSRYHRQSCPEAKGIVLPNRRLNNATQLKQWGYTPCLICKPDDPKDDVEVVARIARDSRKHRGGAKGEHV